MVKGLSLGLTFKWKGGIRKFIGVNYNIRAIDKDERQKIEETFFP